MPETVWLLWCCAYEDSYVHAVFWTREAAHAYLMRQGWVAAEAGGFQWPQKRRKPRLDGQILSELVRALRLEEVPVLG